MAKRISFHSRRVADIPVGAWIPHSAELIHRRHGGHAQYMWYGCWIASSWSIARTPVARTDISRCRITSSSKRVLGGASSRPRSTKLSGCPADRRAGLYGGGARRQPSRYRLTYLKWKFVPAAGAPYYLEPTHVWRHFRPEKKARKSGRMPTTGEPPRSTTGELSKRPRKRLPVTHLADLAARRRT